MVDTVINAFISGINASIKVILQSEMYVNDKKDIKSISTHLDALLNAVKKEFSQLPKENQNTAFRAEILKRKCKEKELQLPKKSPVRLALKSTRKTLTSIAENNKKIAHEIEGLDKLLEKVSDAESGLLTAMLADFSTQMLVLLTGVPGAAIIVGSLVTQKICFGISRKCIAHAKKNKESQSKKIIFNSNIAFLEVARDLISAEKELTLIPKEYLEILENYIDQESNLDKIFSALVDLNVLRTYLQTEPDHNLIERRKFLMGTIEDLSVQYKALAGKDAYSPASYRELAALAEQIKLLNHEKDILEKLMGTKIPLKNPSVLTPAQKKQVLLQDHIASLEDDDRKADLPRPTVPALVAQLSSLNIKEMRARVENQPARAIPVHVENQPTPAIPVHDDFLSKSPPPTSNLSHKRVLAKASSLRFFKLHESPVKTGARSAGSSPAKRKAETPASPTSPPKKGKPMMRGKSRGVALIDRLELVEISSQTAPLPTVSPSLS